MATLKDSKYCLIALTYFRQLQNNKQSSFLSAHFLEMSFSNLNIQMLINFQATSNELCYHHRCFGQVGRIKKFNCC